MIHKTYYVENENGTIVDYFQKLSDAKECVIENPKSIIVMLKGPYKYEGFHQYKLALVNDKFKYIWKR